MLCSIDYKRGFEDPSVVLGPRRCVLYLFLVFKFTWSRAVIAIYCLKDLSPPLTNNPYYSFLCSTYCSKSKFPRPRSQGMRSTLHSVLYHCLKAHYLGSFLPLSFCNTSDNISVHITEPVQEIESRSAHGYDQDTKGHLLRHVLQPRAHECKNDGPVNGPLLDIPKF